MRAILDKDIPCRFEARGFSMRPFILDGDKVTVSPRPREEINPGDVVAYCQPKEGGLVVHRVVARSQAGYQVQGDNALEGDGLISPEQLLGLVTRVERRGRTVRLGQGPERRLIAWLARRDLLRPLLFSFSQVLRPFLWRSSG